jgi:hypothetical protein
MAHEKYSSGPASTASGPTSAIECGRSWISLRSWDSGHLSHVLFPTETNYIFGIDTDQEIYGYLGSSVHTNQEEASL